MVLDMLKQQPSDEDEYGNIPDGCASGTTNDESSVSRSGYKIGDDPHEIRYHY